MISNLKNRAALKQAFMEGAIPSQKDFADLINAVLVKRDDHFMGYWQLGAGYEVGDVVLYNETSGEQKGNVGIYAFVSKKAAQDIATALGKPCDCLDDDCGNKPPSECCRWQLVHINSDDGDWKIAEDKKAMYAKIVGKIGIGTEKPTAFLHLKDDTEGVGSQFLFNPKGEGGNAAHLQILKGLEAAGETSIQLDQKLDLEAVSWSTTAPAGYIFKKTATPTNEDSEDTTTRDLAHHHHSESANENESVVLLVLKNDNNRPRVGIGTDSDQPNAALEVANKSKNTAIQLDVDSSDAPELILLRMDAEHKLSVIQSIDNQNATWSTNAAHGFLFKHKNGKNLLALDENGNVGIGTTMPKSKLEISDKEGKQGKFSFNVESAMPNMVITNLKQGDDAEVHLDVSVDNNVVAFSTNAEKGFDFNLRDETVLALLPDKNANPMSSSAVVQGFVRSEGLYVRPLQGDIKPLNPEDSLATLLELKPSESKKLVKGDNHVQMGFPNREQASKSLKMAKQFPDDTYGIAQHNLIALLVSTVQNLDKRLKEHEDTIMGLKKELAALKSPKK